MLGKSKGSHGGYPSGCDRLLGYVWRPLASPKGGKDSSTRTSYAILKKEKTFLDQESRDSSNVALGSISEQKYLTHGHETETSTES